jgi:hypothetical protein
MIRRYLSDLAAQAKPRLLWGAPVIRWDVSAAAHGFVYQRRRLHLDLSAAAWANPATRDDCVSPAT